MAKKNWLYIMSIVLVYFLLGCKSDECGGPGSLRYGSCMMSCVKQCRKQGARIGIASSDCKVKCSQYCSC